MITLNAPAGTETPRGHIPTLDGWRGLAVLIVMARHAVFGIFDRESPEFFAAMRMGLGVDIFFALSGFLISTRLLDDRRKHGTIDLGTFFMRRGLRILPAFLAYLAVLTVLASAGLVPLSRRELVGCLLFVRNYLPAPDVNHWFTAHFWSLAVQEHFYLFWPLVLIVFRPSGSLKVAGSLALSVAAWRKLDAHFQLVSPYGLGRTDLRIDALLWGAFLALLVHQPETRAAVARRLTPNVWRGVVLALLATYWFQPLGALALEPLLMPWMVYGTVVNPGLLWSRVLESSALRQVGRLSFSLYIWQQLFLSPEWLNARISPFLPTPGTNLLAGLAATFLAGATSYYALERPFARAGSRLRSATRRGGRFPAWPRLAPKPFKGSTRSL